MVQKFTPDSHREPVPGTVPIYGDSEGDTGEPPAYFDQFNPDDWRGEKAAEQNTINHAGASVGREILKATQPTWVDRSAAERDRIRAAERATRPQV